MILPPEEIKTPVAEVIPNEQNITILWNGTSNPSVEVDPSMAGKKYKVISITWWEVREGIIEDTTIDFGNMIPGVYLLGIEWMPRWAAKKIIVQ